MPAYKTPEEKIRGNVFADMNSGCWLFQGGLDSCGYAKINGGRDFPGETLGHRISYKFYIGPVPDGTEIDHKCRVRSCINPAHLQAISHAENVARGDYKTTHRNAVKTHCKRGHQFTVMNTMVNRWGNYTARKCRICNNAAQAQNRLKREKMYSYQLHRQGDR